MGGIGIWQILIVALVVLVLFGRGRISERDQRPDRSACQKGHG